MQRQTTNTLDACLLATRNRHQVTRKKYLHIYDKAVSIRKVKDTLKSEFTLTSQFKNRFIPFKIPLSLYEIIVITKKRKTFRKTIKDEIITLQITSQIVLPKCFYNSFATHSDWRWFTAIASISWTIIKLTPIICSASAKNGSNNLSFKIKRFVCLAFSFSSLSFLLFSLQKQKKERKLVSCAGVCES